MSSPTIRDIQGPEKPSRYPAFPGEYFVPTAVIWGFWSAGMMAGINYIRMGLIRTGYAFIALAVLSQAAVWLILIRLGHGVPAAGITLASPEGSPVFHVPLGRVALVALTLLINGGAGYAILIVHRRRLGRAPACATQLPRLLQTVSPRVTVLALLGFCAALVAVITLLMWLTP